MLTLSTQEVKAISATLVDAPRYVNSLREHVLEAYKHRLLLLRTNKLPPAPDPISEACTPGSFVRWRWKLQLQSLAETAAVLAPTTEVADIRPPEDMSLAIAQSGRWEMTEWLRTEMCTSHPVSRRPGDQTHPPPTVEVRLYSNHWSQAD